jgi:hypothetical protein
MLIFWVRDAGAALTFVLPAYSQMQIQRFRVQPEGEEASTFGS